MDDRSSGKEAFQDFFLRSSDSVFRSVMVAAGDRNLAEDATAEAYARAYERWTAVSQHPSPVGWVARTALNLVRTSHRKNRRVQALGDVEIEATDDPPIDPYLVKAVLSLPQRQREVIALRVLLDLDTEQTAAILAVAPGTVTAHLHRALSRLERELVNTLSEEA